MTTRSSRRSTPHVAKLDPVVPRRTPRVFVSGGATVKRVETVAIDGQPADIIGDEGEADYVLLPRGDYERLVELLEDRSAMAAHDRTRNEESVPSAVVGRLLSGESPVRVWREHRSLSLTNLAGKAALSKGFLSDIENGKRTGTVNTLKSLAAVLDVDLDDLA
jgi:DNA-binding XRE family transcriptional regulator